LNNSGKVLDDSGRDLNDRDKDLDLSYKAVDHFNRESEIPVLPTEKYGISFMANGSCHIVRMFHQDLKIECLMIKTESNE